MGKNVLSERHRRAIELHAKGQFGAATALYDQELAENPSGLLHFNRAVSLWELGRTEEAVAGYDRAIALEPDYLPAQYNRALSLLMLRRLPEALIGLDAAIALRGDMAELWNNRAGVLQEMGRYGEALESLDRAMSLKPADARTLYNRGALLLQLERPEEAVVHLRQALALDGRHPEALSKLASAALKSCDWALVEELEPRLTSELTADKAVIAPLMLLNYCDDPRLQQKSARLNLARDLAGAPALSGPLWRGEDYGHQRPRIGYLSSDLREHPVGRMVAGLFERHDKERFEIIALSTGADDGSALAVRLEKACGQFHHLAGHSDRAVADLIRALEVDVLVDLNGQTEGWRPAVLQSRPAPVIATWLGFAGTIGAPFVDYVIADPVVAPLSEQPFFDETIWQLPTSFWPGMAPIALPRVSRIEAGLPGEGFVFACFNNVWKIRREQFRGWMELLRALPFSMLWLRQTSPAIAAKLRAEARALGIGPERLVFAPPAATTALHLARLRHADLVLDTFPYNGHATTADALLAGVPVLSRKGKSFAARVAASLTCAADQPELVTEGLADYLALALALAKDRPRLEALRQKLKTAHSHAPLFDPVRFARDLEAGFIGMLERRRTAAYRPSPRS
jgi:predicted O-linked N-acetylglucosamine transferase (SPINDLY family)